MLTAADLEGAFHIYISELQRARASKCYFALLHVILSLPDICAALEHSKGKASGDAYMRWCDRFLPNGTTTGADWYKMRCALVHQGSSVPETDRGIPSQYAVFSFVDPDNLPPGWHRHVTLGSKGPILTLDVADLADEMLAAVRRWFDDLVDPANAGTLAFVTDNLPQLVREQPKTVTREHVDTSGEIVFIRADGGTRSSS